MTRTRLLLLDFDGTLCLGDDPVFTYAEHVDRLLAERGLSSHLGRPVRAIAERAIEQQTLLVDDIAYNQTGQPVAAAQENSSEADDATAHPVSWPLQDGYQLVQLLAKQAGLSDAASGQAFRSARKDLVSRGFETTDLHAPAGVHQLLAEIRRTAVVVLVTNSPASAFTPWLQALGLTGIFDAVINDAHKPFGMPEAVTQARAAGGAHRIEPTEILSVGDIWRNDLAHVDAIGGRTVLIDRFATGLGAPHYRVGSFDEAAPLIRQWAGTTEHGASPLR